MTPPTEHAEQVAVVRWADAMAGLFPPLGLLLAIPNGGARTAVTGARLRAEGVRRGVPDLLLPVARRGHHGLWIELKRQGATASRTTPQQRWWLERLREEGHSAHLCAGAREAIETIEWYLGIGYAATRSTRRAEPVGESNRGDG